MHLSVFDYTVIVFYLFFMFCLGPVFKSFSKTASDFFRGSGGMIWWIVGCSVFMTSFSAWSFTGGAAKAYETGTFFLLLFGANVISTLFTYFFTAARFRQIRVITPIEAIRKRFDSVNEQVFTWVPIPYKIIFGGISLYTIGIFMSSVFNMNMQLVIIVLGVTVTLMTLVGGSWAAIASDFVQMLVVLSITLVMIFLTLRHPDIGGLSGLLARVPAHHFDWALFERPSVIVFFALTLVINQIILSNNLIFGAAKYIFCKDGRDGKRAALFMIFGMIILSPIIVIPAMAATILHPNLASEYPKLNNPDEAAYVAMAVTLLPKGLLGLLISGIFAATICGFTASLNGASGIFVRNFYIRIINTKASEAQQILMGRISIGVMGVLLILCALVFSTMRDMPVFNLVLLSAAAVGIPTAVPLFFGIFIKRAPAWAGWSTAAVGFTVSVILRIVLTDGFIQKIWGGTPPLSKVEINDVNIAITTAVLFGVCIAWFCGTILFARYRKPEYIKQVDDFYTEMNTPINTAVEHGPSYDSDRRQYGVMAYLCMIYGGVILLLTLVPNSRAGHIGFLFCGSFIFVIGAIIWLIGKRIKNDSGKAITANINKSQTVDENSEISVLNNSKE